MKWGLHWFRRDLRIQGNPGLRNLFQECEGRVLGVFFFDPKFLGRPDFSANRFAFFLKTLRVLAQEMDEAGSELLVLPQGPETGFEWILQNTATPPAKITHGRDYEPFARTRDAQIEKWAGSKKIPLETFRDHLAIEPGEFAKPDGSYYKVYTPYSRRWFEHFAKNPLSEEKIAIKPEAPKDLFKLRWARVLKPGTENPSAKNLELFERQNQAQVTLNAFPEAGFSAAWKRLQAFSKIQSHYTEKRDFPAVPGTSQLSVYFKNGSITPGQVIKGLGLRQEPQSQFFKEIVWREFYYQILWNKPSVEQTAFQEKYANLKWENKSEYFEAWKEGKTGYPIVDAGMRQLKQTGWMHNRVRMIVASFLTKDLLVDWRWGEAHFMKLLLDGDLAPNNGGWQWAASTGCDPQPYFRVFNPVLQSEKFDPSGEYIKRYIPELAELPSAHLHAPWEHGGATGYPAPVVDHATQKKKAIELFNV